MCNDKQAERAAKTQNQESFFVYGMIWVIDQAGTLIGEHSDGIFE